VHLDAAVVADQPVFRTAFASLAILAICARSEPLFVTSFCLVLDVRMAHKSGLTLQEELNAVGAHIPIVFISGHGDISVAIKAIKAGAVDFVQKPYREQQLLDSINEALRRDAEIRQANNGGGDLTGRLATLSERESDVLQHVVRGPSSKAIAKELDISYRTVELHRSHIMEKLRVRSVAELIRLMMERQG
jgi:two-component system response regulator DctR